MMTPAEKLQKIAENEQKVYDAGRASGVAQGTEEGYAIGYAEGKQAEYDAFWDAFQNNGNADDYTYAFSHGKWLGESYNPKYTIKVSYGNGLFQNSILTDTKVAVDISGAYQYYYLFTNASNMETIRTLKIAETQRFTDEFTRCTALKNITIDGTIGRNFYIQYSPLTAASITSIINALSTTASGYTVQLSKTAVQNAFETSEGAADGNTSEEWLNLIATKSNWTISLV